MPSPRSTAPLRRRVPPSPSAASPDNPSAKRPAATKNEAADAPLPAEMETSSPPSYASSLRSGTSGPAAATMTMKLDPRSAWMVFAVASGTCAAFNGVFAKLTTTELTTAIAAAIAGFLRLGGGSRVVEFVIRAIFFALNLAFNALMWILFTRALTLHPSTTRVAILNTSSNFLFTAILGLLIFREALPPLWFVGAGMLVVGNVIIGMRDREGEEGGKGDGQEEGMRLMSTDGREEEEGDEEEGGWKGDEDGDGDGDGDGDEGRRGEARL